MTVPQKRGTTMPLVRTGALAALSLSLAAVGLAGCGSSGASGGSGGQSFVDGKTFPWR